jgi:hypothetical protein
MMARGRGGASGGALAGALLAIGLLVVATSAPLAEAAAAYMVGDYGGWKFNVDRWAKGRTFRAGDQLGKQRAAPSPARPPPRIASSFFPSYYAARRDVRICACAVFNYNRAVHDVAVVNAAAYRSCVVPRGARVLRSGRDKVRLGRGTHYFVCTVRGHCQAGMKIAVRAV